MTLRFLRPARPRPTAKPVSTGGRRLYAVGDIHGRLDLLGPLLEEIHRNAFQGELQTKPVLIFLGDYVDRGASSKGVVDRVLKLEREADFELCALKGNHDDALLSFLTDATLGPAWCEHGGTQTLVSYGVLPPIARPDDAEAWEATREAFAERLPQGHLRFFHQLKSTAVYGDYVFVHAGLRPGVALEAQSELDLLWIRDDFLDASEPFEKIVVHGHTPQEDVFIGRRRIGIDTGAYATGVLTAVRLEGNDRRIVQTRAAV